MNKIVKGCITLEDNKHPTARYVHSVAVYFKDKGR